uniref:Smad nuclear interacting protein 1 n=1 Tax=Xiphophorus maculatus TaxID=8083 RepID=A0A3B5QL11_XIPMA
MPQEKEEQRGSGDERRRRNEQSEDRRSRWESDRPRDRERNRDRNRERTALASQQEERRQHDDRRRENRQRREEGGEEHNFGTSDGGSDDSRPPPAEKEKPNFELSGALTEDTNTFRGVVIKYNEPPEARIPKRRWRLYPFKNDDPLPVMYIHRQSAYLLGRQRKIADIPIDHPSCSKQHAVFQYRLVEYTRADGTTGRRVRPYIIDLASGNGTYLNNQRIESQRYYELKEKDVLKFGFSSREYVLLHEFSDTSEVDVKQEDEEEDDEGIDE